MYSLEDHAKHGQNYRFVIEKVLQKLKTHS